MPQVGVVPGEVGGEEGGGRVPTGNASSTWLCLYLAVESGVCTTVVAHY